MMKPVTQLRNLFIVAASLACFTVLLAPKTFGVVPAPDGGYPGGNTAEGQNALFSLTTGGFNTGVGFFALRANTTGQFNTALGAGTLLANTADRNTAIGAAALLTNSNGHDNTATGVFALLNNTTGSDNTAHGGGALLHNVDGSSNTAMGVNALLANASGGGNTAVGGGALSNSTGDGNTGIGNGALFGNTTGSFNTALGTAAGTNLTGDNNIYIGYTVAGVAGESHTIRIGNPNNAHTFIAGIHGVAVDNATQVYIDANGRLGTVTSSRRFKKDIQPMDKSSEAILALKPVTFRYKKEIDATGKSQFGLVAEEVEKVNPDLVVCDKEGTPYSVRYDQVNAMLLNEFLKEHRQVQEQKTTIAELKSAMTQQQKQIEALCAVVQKVSAQLELNKPAPQTVLNKP
jgi:hypothetical protein